MPAIDMKLEIVVVPVSDVDRAKRFYGGLGRLDADLDNGDDFCVNQFTPPVSGLSVIFGKNSPRQLPAPPRGCISSSQTSRPRAPNWSAAASR
jgi:hypothetical protein